MAACPQENEFCFSELVANEQRCVNDKDPEFLCNTMHRMENFLIYARLAFCSSEPGSGMMNGCSVWEKIGCTVAVLSAAVACSATGPVLLTCVIGILGASSCIPCICDILNC